MIRNWVKNLCTYIDNLDASCSTEYNDPKIGESSIRVYIFKEDPVSATMIISNPSARIDINEVEYYLLQNSIKEFSARVNEKRVIDFLKPFTNGVPEEI